MKKIWLVVVLAIFLIGCEYEYQTVRATAPHVVNQMHNPEQNCHHSA